MSPAAAGSVVRGRSGLGPAPTLRVEKSLLRQGHSLVAGMDEVGRGALAGPVTVGVVVVEAQTRGAPAGVRDSKLLAPAARQALVPKLRRWTPGYAVGHAEPHEIDAYGIIAALRLAGRRALAQLPQLPTLVLLDGSHDWLTLPLAPPVDDRQGLLDLDLGPAPAGVGGAGGAPLPLLSGEPDVVTKVKADLRCAAVAAASVLAKVARDAIMVDRAEQFPHYRWDHNKGYSAPEHVAALRRLGPCPQHRQSWSLPQLQGPHGAPLWVDLTPEDEPEDADEGDIEVEIDRACQVEVAR